MDIYSNTTNIAIIYYFLIIIIIIIIIIRMNIFNATDLDSGSHLRILTEKAKNRENWRHMIDRLVTISNLTWQGRYAEISRKTRERNLAAEEKRATAAETQPETALPRRRGRPLGSKNRPRAVQT